MSCLRARQWKLIVVPAVLLGFAALAFVQAETACSMAEVTVQGGKASKLLAHLTGPKGHHDLKLTPEELYRITLWIDCNTNFHGAYLETEKQARGGLMPPSVE